MPTNPNPYRTVEAAYARLARRQPAWLTTLTPTPHHQPADGMEQLDRLVKILNSDRLDTRASDDLARRLVTIARTDPDAICIILRACLPRCRKRIGTTTGGWDFHTDVITTVAMVCLDSDLTGQRVVQRIVNRAHNRVRKEALRSRVRGATNIVVTNPVAPDILAGLHDGRGHHGTDHADGVADVVDLARFAQAVRTAVEMGEITQRTWDEFREMKLARALYGGERLTNVQRSHAHRARLQMKVLIDERLKCHAA